VESTEKESKLVHVYLAEHRDVRHPPPVSPRRSAVRACPWDRSIPVRSFRTARGETGQSRQPGGTLGVPRVLLAPLPERLIAALRKRLGHPDRGSVASGAPGVQ
jgi:hypothetical protein